MRKQFLVLCLTGFVTGSLAMAARAEKERTVSLDQVPVAVWVTIQRHAEGANIVEIEVGTERQIQVYEVETEKGGEKSEFLVASDGEYLGAEAEEDEGKSETGETKSRMALPEAVAKTFKKEFPQGKIAKIDAEQENGVIVYDIEFKEGKTEKETDIAADGTMLEFSIVVNAKTAPDAAMRAARQAAEGARIGHVEQVEISYQTKDGKVIKLPNHVTQYEVEMTRHQRAEIMVAADGTVIEPPEWVVRKARDKHEEDEQDED